MLPDLIIIIIGFIFTVIRNIKNVTLFTGTTTDARPVLELDREADGAGGGQHLVALQQVVAHQLGDLVAPLPLGLDHLQLGL